MKGHHMLASPLRISPVHPHTLGRANMKQAQIVLRPPVLKNAAVQLVQLVHKLKPPSIPSGPKRWVLGNKSTELDLRSRRKPLLHRRVLRASAGGWIGEGPRSR